MFVKTLPHHACLTFPNPIYFEQSLVWKIGLISGFSASLFFEAESTILAMAMMQTMQSQDLGQLLQRLSPQEFVAFELYCSECAESMIFCTYIRWRMATFPGGNVGKHSSSPWLVWCTQGKVQYIYFLLSIRVSSIFLRHEMMWKKPAISYIYLHQFFHDCWRFMPHLFSCSFKLLLELGPSSMGYLCAEGSYTLFICYRPFIWSNYSDFTQGTSPQKGKSNFKKTSRLVKLYLARLAGHKFGIAILERRVLWGGATIL